MPPISQLFSQLWALFLKDEKTALLPDVVALFQYIAANGVSLAGGPQLMKALVALEADAIAGGQQFAKDASTVILAWFQAGQSAAKFVKAA